MGRLVLIALPGTPQAESASITAIVPALMTTGEKILVGGGGLGGAGDGGGAAGGLVLHVLLGSGCEEAYTRRSPMYLHAACTQAHSLAMSALHLTYRGAGLNCCLKAGASLRLSPATQTRWSLNAPPAVIRRGNAPVTHSVLQPRCSAAPHCCKLRWCCGCTVHCNAPVSRQAVQSTPHPSKLPTSTLSVPVLTQ